MAFTIRELESLSGIKAHTIRIWEQRYGFLKPSRTQTNIRTYSNDELKTILTVALLNKYGYKISKIDAMAPEQREQLAMQLPETDAQRELSVNELLGHMVDLESLKFEEVLNRHIRRHGIEYTVTDIIFHFLEKVGILWQTNRIIPIQEHIVSAIIRQKLVAAVEALPLVQNNGPLFVLYLPEGEHHELGLLYVYYLLRRRNIPVLYLGANVPLKDVHYLLTIRQPYALYLHLTTYSRHHNLLKYLANLTAKTGSTRIVLSGILVQGQKLAGLPQVQALTSLAQVSSYISSVQ